MSAKKPYEIIRELVEVRTNWTNDQILAELAALPVLPDEYLAPRLHNPAWDDEGIINQLYLFLALADLIAQRKLKAGVPLLLERASYGDVGETMRGLRHSLEAAFKDDWNALEEICIVAAKSPNKGCRLWAIEELRRFLRDDIRSGQTINSQALSTLIDALYDPAQLVREEAITGLAWCAEYAELKATIVPALERYVSEQSEIVEDARKLLGKIQSPNYKYDDY